MRLLILFGLIFQLQSGWIKLSSSEGKFVVLSPGEFIQKIIKTESPVGELAYHIFIHQSQDSSTQLYMISYCDYPVEFNMEDSVELKEELFQATIDEAVQSVSGELRYQTDDASYQHAGKFWRIDYTYPGGEAMIKTKAFFWGSRYYAVQFVGQLGASDQHLADRFLKSFHLSE